MDGRLGGRGRIEHARHRGLGRLQLQAAKAAVPRVLDPAAAAKAPIHAVTYNEASFRWALNEDAMATEKLAEGIRAFAVDAAKLDRMIEAL